MNIITTHNNTDFDALASVVAATLLYPDAVPVLPKNINPNVKNFISIHKDIFELQALDEIVFDQVKRLIVVDINNWDRLGHVIELMDNKKLEIYLWDHHNSTGTINPKWKCVEAVGANISLMVRQLKKDNIPITPIQATLFLIGIYEDTGHLTFPLTTAGDAHAAAFLLEQKADLDVLSSFLTPTYGEKQKNVLFEMIKTATRTKISGSIVSFNKLEIEEHVEGLALVVKMYREILNIDAAFGIFTNQKQGRCFVIGRSNSPEINIGSILQGIGGGGHPGAGSAVLRRVNPDGVEVRLRELIEGGNRSYVKAGDLMSFPVYSVTTDNSMETVAKVLRDKGCTGVPVVEKETLVGIISRRDFKKIKKERQLKSPVKAYMNTNVLTVDPDRSIMQATRLMVKHDIGRMPVVKEGRLIGILTRSDVMLYFYDLMPD